MKYSEIKNIDSVAALVGLCFPDSANDFQRAVLTLAHVMASVREMVLKGSEVPTPVLDLISSLTFVIDQYDGPQK